MNKKTLIKINKKIESKEFFRFPRPNCRPEWEWSYFYQDKQMAACGQSFTSYHSAARSVNRVMKNLLGVRLKTYTANIDRRKRKCPHFEALQSLGGGSSFKWNWSMIGRGGLLMAGGCNDFPDQPSLNENIDFFFHNFPKASVIHMLDFFPLIKDYPTQELK